MKTRPGPWDAEDDRVDFIHANTACFIKRNQMGVWCGYASVDKNHPLYGEDYDTPEILVHGGLTYADKCQGDLCHTPAEGFPADVWWFGFDCGHGRDIMPKMLLFAVVDLPDSVYRTQEYAMNETKKMADQLAAYY